MTSGTRRRLRLFLRMLSASALVGVGFGTAVGHFFPQAGGPLTGALVGALTALMVAATVGGSEIFLMRTRPGRALEQAPFLVTLLVKSLVYGTVITVIQVGDIAARLAGLSSAAGPSLDSVALVSTLFSFAVTLAFMFVMQVGRIVGRRTLRDWILGRYHRPRIEERFFLFVDVVGSTALAERIGPAAVHRFLDRVFRLASDPIDDHRGEIYQYVGDEMVVTWTLADGRPAARPIACFLAIRAALAEAAQDFERDLGARPSVRAALHAGAVIAGEVGDQKRDIVFHGDVMNTAARLEQATRDLDRGFLVSADALARLEGSTPYEREDLGPRVLRGRAAPVHVYAVGPPGAA